MGTYLLRRTLVAVGLLYVVATLIFSFIHLVPGDPALILLSGGGSSVPDPSAVAALRHQLGLDLPLSTQYRDYLARLARLDLGRSLQDQHPVARDIAERLPRTLELVVVAVALGAALGIPLGVLAAANRNRWADLLASAVASGGISIPVFVVGTLLVLLFAVKLRWLPAGGYAEITADPWAHLRQALLPSVTIAFGLMAVVARMTRSSMLEALGQDFVRTARAKGLAEGHVLARHVLRNALIPVLTLVGLQLGTLLGGTVLVEYVFNWPGLSSLLVTAVERRDYPEVQGIVLVISALFILLNLLVDLTYGVLDPRIRVAGDA